MFRVTFRAKSDSDFLKVRRRRITVSAIEILVYLLLAAIMGVDLILTLKNYIVTTYAWVNIYSILNNITAISFAVTTMLAVRHIHINS